MMNKSLNTRDFSRSIRTTLLQMIAMLFLILLLSLTFFYRSLDGQLRSSDERLNHSIQSHLNHFIHVAHLASSRETLEQKKIYSLSQQIEDNKTAHEIFLEPFEGTLSKSIQFRDWWLFLHQNGLMLQKSKASSIFLIETKEFLKNLSDLKIKKISLNEFFIYPNNMPSAESFFCIIDNQIHIKHRSHLKSLPGLTLFYYKNVHTQMINFLAFLLSLCFFIFLLFHRLGKLRLKIKDFGKEVFRLRYLSFKLTNIPSFKHDQLGEHITKRLRAFEIADNELTNLNWTFEETAEIGNATHRLILEISTLLKEISSSNMQLQEKIRTSDHFHTLIHKVISSMPSAMILLDENLIIQMVNLECERLSGFEKEHMVGKSLFQFYPWLASLQEEFHSAIDQEKIYAKSEMIVPSREPQLILDLTFYPLSKEKKDAVIRLDNRTEHRKLITELHHHQKMENIGKLAGSVAHDFNNMIGGMIHSAEVLLYKVEKENHLVHEQAENIISIAEKAATLNKSLLSFSRRANFINEPIRISKLIQEVVSMTSTNLTTTFETKPEEDIYVKGDKAYLHNAILNLCINAKDAMKDGEESTIELYQEHVDQTHRHTFTKKLKPNNYAVIKVKDTGAGIPKEYQNKVFDPFFTTKKTNKGTGLGLTNVYGTMENHGGVVGFETEVGIGTSFYLYLPILKNTPLLLQEKESDKVKLHEKTILIIDDDDTALQASKESLKDAGCKVFTAKNGEEGLDTYKKNKTFIDFVILDLIMPKLSGGEVLLALKRENRDLPVLLCSGHQDDQDLEQLMNAKHVDFISKPYRREALFKKIITLMDDIR